MKKKSILVLDFIGISSASLCMIHCLVFPILSVIPVGITNNHWLDVFFACISMFVVSKIIMSKSPKNVKFILSTSILTVITGVVLESIWDICTQLVLIGGIGMIIGHLLNYKSHSK